VLEHGSRTISFDTTLTISGDDKVLQTLRIKAGDLPQSFDINVSGVDKLTIRLDKFTSSGTGEYNVGIVNAGFYE
jgi:hypothetical protein